jgi:phosphohistidine phosphatase
MIYLVHHGDAVGADVDARRPLSEGGRGAVLLLADLAARKGVRPEAIWHSGKLRARQTAELFWKVCHPLASLTAERGLQPDDPPHWMRDRLAGETRDVMVVGHMPHLPRLLAALTASDRAGSAVAFPPHGLVALEPAGGAWQERYRLP